MDAETYSLLLKILNLQNELTMLRSIDNPTQDINEQIQDICNQLEYTCSSLPHQQHMVINAAISTTNIDYTNLNVTLSISREDEYENEDEDYELNLERMTDVPIVMSNQEVNEKYPEKKFVIGMKTKNNKCPIAQTKFNSRSRIRQLSCMHTYTSDNIFKWLTKNSTRCPICRIDAR